MKRLGPYELLQTLGRGAMGTVWRARHVELGAVRALKVLALRTPARRERFRRETEHLARIRHPNVVAIHDAGLEGSRGWFAMDLIEGCSLREALEGGPLPPARALEVADGLAAGLEALHVAGIAHRDLKPDNVVLRSDGTPVLIDLGLAVAPEEDQRLTRTGALLGTVAYMAPEQLYGDPAGPPADVFAWALVVAELFTGRRLARDEPRATPSSSDLPTPLPPGLGRVLDQAWRPRPEERPSLSELRRSLQAPPPAAASRGLLALVALASLAALASAGALWAASRPDPARASAPPSSRATPRPQPDPLRLARDAFRARAALRLFERLRDAPPEGLAGASGAALRDEVLAHAQAELERGPEAASPWLRPLGLLEARLGGPAPHPFAQRFADAVLEAVYGRALDALAATAAVEALASSGLRVRAATLELLLDEFVRTYLAERRDEPWGVRLLAACARCEVDLHFDHYAIAAGKQPRGEDPLALYLRLRLRFVVQRSRGVRAAKAGLTTSLGELAPRLRAELPLGARTDAERLLFARQVERGELDPRERLARLRELGEPLGQRAHSSLRLALGTDLFELWRAAPPDLAGLARAALLDHLGRLELPPAELLARPSLRLRDAHLRYLMLLVVVEQPDVAAAHVAAFAADPELHERLRESLEGDRVRWRRFRETGTWSGR